MLLLTYAPIASEIVNTDRTIRIGDNQIPKHFFFLQNTFFLKKEPVLKLFCFAKTFTKKCLRYFCFAKTLVSLVKLSF
nr:hypothetical protein GZ36D8_19 [uncultured archaeon GZfos36D8]